MLTFVEKYEPLHRSSYGLNSVQTALLQGFLGIKLHPKVDMPLNKRTKRPVILKEKSSILYLLFLNFLYSLFLYIFSFMVLSSLVSSSPSFLCFAHPLFTPPFLCFFPICIFLCSSLSFFLVLSILLSSAVFAVIAIFGSSLNWFNSKQILSSWEVLPHQSYVRKDYRPTFPPLQFSFLFFF